MTVLKPDDSYLSPSDKKIIEDRAMNMLHRADAWDRFPVPVDDILEAANLKVAPKSMFDPAAILSYLKTKAADVEHKLKKAVSKILGIYDAGESIIHIDDSVVVSKQNFLKLHETGHHDIPTHRKIFRFFQDCEKTLSPDTADQFEREANNFARYILFKGNTFGEHAADHEFGIKTPMKLAKQFGASLYASTREYARTNERACAVFILEPMQFLPDFGAQAYVRRIEASSRFIEGFGLPNDQVINQEHFLWDAVPVGRKMTYPTPVRIQDKNGQIHECLAEAFDTTYNILVLLYPVKELTPIISVSSWE